MPDAEAIVELRSLQERAYGRGGGLSDVDAARLRELEGLPAVERGSATAEEPRVVERGSEATETKRGSLHRFQGTGDSSPSGRSTTEARSTPRLRSGLRARGAALAALIVAILVGVLVGWALFSPRAPQAVPLSAEQQSWQNEILVSAVYDSGSLRPIAEEDGTIVWFATRDGGDIVCAIISDGETTAPACRERDVAIMRGLQTSLRREVDGGEGLVEAQILFDAEGDPAALTSHSLITRSSDDADS